MPRPLPVVQHRDAAQVQRGPGPCIRAQGVAGCQRPSVKRAKRGLDPRGPEVRLDPGTIDFRILFKCGEVDIHDGFEFVPARQGQAQCGDVRPRPKAGGAEGHKALAHDVTPVRARHARGHANRPRQAALGVESERPADVGLGSDHVGVVPLGMREPGGHEADVAQLCHCAPERLAQESLGLPSVGDRGACSFPEFEGARHRPIVPARLALCAWPSEPCTSWERARAIRG